MIKISEEELLDYPYDIIPLINTILNLHWLVGFFSFSNLIERLFQTLISYI